MPAGPYTINIDSLTPDDSIERFVSFVLPTSTEDGSDIETTVSVTATEPDPMPSNNSATAQATVTRVADLSIDVVADRTTISPGAPLTYSVTVRNNGPSFATSIDLTADLSPGFSFDDTLSANAGWTENRDPDRGMFLLTRTFAEGLAVGGQVTFRIVTRLSPSFEVQPGSNSRFQHIFAAESATEDNQSSNDSALFILPILPRLGGDEVLRDDSIIVQQNTILPIKLTKLTANDRDGALIEEFSQPDKGELRIASSSKRIIYVPDPGKSGSDSFTYTAQVGNGSQTVLELHPENGQSSQINLQTGAWSFDSGVASEFQFVLDNTELDSAVLSSLTSGKAVERVTIRSLINSGVGFLTDIGRWTLHDVTFLAYESVTAEQTIDTTVTYSAAFDQIEFDVASPPMFDQAAPGFNPGFHVGLDVTDANSRFDSGRFNSGSNPASSFQDRNAKFQRDAEATGLYLSAGDRVTSDVLQASVSFNRFSVSETDENVSGSVSIQLGEFASVLVPELLDAAARNKVIAKLSVDRFINNEFGGAFLSEQYDLENVRVQSVQSTLGSVTDTLMRFDVELSFERLNLRGESQLGESTVKVRNTNLDWNLTEQTSDGLASIETALITAEDKRNGGGVLEFPTGDTEPKQNTRGVPIDDLQISAIASTGRGDDPDFQFTLSAPLGGWSQGILAAVITGEKFPQIVLRHHHDISSGSSNDELPESSRITLENAVFTRAALVSDAETEFFKRAIEFTIRADSFRQQSFRLQGDGKTVMAEELRIQQAPDFKIIGGPSIPGQPLLVNEGVDSITFGNALRVLVNEVPRSVGVPLLRHEYSFARGHNQSFVEVEFQSGVQSSELFTALATGFIFDKVTLVSRVGTSSGPTDQHVTELNGVMVTSIVQQHSEGGTATDVVRLTFDDDSSFDLQSKVIDRGSGTVEGVVQTAFDFAGNQATGGVPTGGLIGKRDVVAQRLLGQSVVLSRTTQNGTRTVSHEGIELNNFKIMLPPVDFKGLTKQMGRLVFSARSSAAINYFLGLHLQEQDADFNLTLGAGGEIRHSFKLQEATVLSVGGSLLQNAVSQPTDASSFEAVLEFPIVEIESILPKLDGNSNGGEVSKQTSINYANGVVEGADVIQTSAIEGSSPQPGRTSLSFGPVDGGSSDSSLAKSTFVIHESRSGLSIADPSRPSSDILVSPASFTTEINSALPAFATTLATQKPIPEATLQRFSGRVDNRSPQVLDADELRNAMITSLEVNYAGGDPILGTSVAFTLTPESLAHRFHALNEDTGTVIGVRLWEFDAVEQKTTQSAGYPETSAIETVSATVSIDIEPFEDRDEDQIGSAIENGAPNDGDGNGDFVPDSGQNNVASLPHPIFGSYVTLAAPEGQRLEKVSIDASPQASTSPPVDLDFRVGLVQYELTQVPNDAATTVTIFVDGASGFNTFYKYGPTPDNPEPHYYRFLFDGRVGAEFLDDRIVVHLRDGERGDDDLQSNGIIVDPGAPVTNVSGRMHQNPVNRFDVSEDNKTSALDALRVINELNRLGGEQELDVPEPGERVSLIDVNGDNRLSAVDALQIINELNRQPSSPQEEPSDSTPVVPVPTQTGQSQTSRSRRLNADIQHPVVTPTDPKTVANPRFAPNSSEKHDLMESTASNRDQDEYEAADDYFRSLGSQLERAVD